MTQSIGEFLANLRKSKGFTQEEVAKQLHISNKTLSSWEKGRTTPDICMLPALAEIYGVAIDEIVRGEIQEGRPAEKPSLSEETRVVLTNGLLTKLKLRQRILFIFCAISILIALLGLVFLIVVVDSATIGAFFSVVGLCALISLSVVIIGSTQFFLLNLGDNEKERATASRIQKKTALFFLLPTIVFLAAFITMLVLADNHYFAYEVQVYVYGKNVTLDRKTFYHSLIASVGAVGFAYLLLTIIHYVSAVRKYDCCGVKKAKAINASAAILIILAFVGSFFCFIYNEKTNTFSSIAPTETPVRPTDGSEPVTFENEEDFLRWAQTIVINEEQENEPLLSGEYMIDWNWVCERNKCLNLYIPYDCDVAQYFHNKKNAINRNEQEIAVTFLDLGHGFYAVNLIPSLEEEPKYYPSGDLIPLSSYEVILGTYAICHIITAETYEYAPEEYTAYLPAKTVRSSSADKPAYYFLPVYENIPIYRIYKDGVKEFLFCRAPQYSDIGIVKESGALIVSKTVVYPGQCFMTDTYGVFCREKRYCGPLVALVFAIVYAAAVTTCVLIYRKKCAGKKIKAK